MAARYFLIAVIGYLEITQLTLVLVALRKTGASCVYYSFRKSENFTKELLQLYDSLSSLIYPRRSDGNLYEQD